jgi:cytochrome P450
MRRFVEFALFSRYFALILDLLGSHKSIRRDVYFKLKAYGIDLMAIDITLFAAMASIGTVLIRAVSDIQRFGINYGALMLEQKRRFVTEVLRLYPTVTTVHRILEQPEIVRVCNRDLALTPGDEVVYPFICSNRDPRVFRDPDRIVLDRAPEEYDRVLSWSKGPHSCPAKEMSIVVTVVMLDALASRFPLDQLKIRNLTF